MEPKLSERIRKSFEKKKEHAELMRTIFAITAVLYVGFIIWLACIHCYEILWWAFNVWLLLVVIAVKNQSEKTDAKLVLTYLDYLESRKELLTTLDAVEREEQIKQASIEYTKSNRPVCIGGDRFSDMIDAMSVNKDFIAGAKWADENRQNTNAL